MHTWLSSQPPLGLPFVINRASPQAVGLVGWWPVLASRGSSVLYSLARPYNGTLQSTTLTWETDSQMGMRLNFPRADAAYISTAFPAPTTGPFTLAGWIRTANAGSYRAILGCSANGGIEWRLNPSEQLELLQESVALVATSGGTVTTAAWAHVALTWASGGAYVFYVNGQAAGSGTNNVTYSAGTFDIGRHGTLSGEGYGGQIADLRVYERSLSDAEIWQMYAPQTRWDLYRVTPSVVAPPIAAPVVSGAIRMPLLGVG